MRDSGSVIAFKHNDKEYDYNFSLEDKEFSYKWNSKQMRSVLYIDEATKCIFSCLAQGSADDIYYNAIDSLAEELFVGKEYKIIHYVTIFYIFLPYWRERCNGVPKISWCSSNGCNWNIIISYSNRSVVS